MNSTMHYIDSQNIGSSDLYNNNNGNDYPQLLHHVGTSHVINPTGVLFLSTSSNRAFYRTQTRALSRNTERSSIFGIKRYERAHRRALDVALAQRICTSDSDLHQTPSAFPVVQIATFVVSRSSDSYMRVGLSCP